MPLSFTLFPALCLAYRPEWAKLQPHSYAQLALAEHHLAIGFEARGGKWISETTDAQLRAMNAEFFKAQASARDALKLMSYWPNSRGVRRRWLKPIRMCGA